MSPNNQDMYRMQQDALRRVWQMQEQARRSVDNPVSYTHLDVYKRQVSECLTAENSKE